MLDLQDTIVALATPPGGALRGIVRISGPRAWQVVGQLFRPALPRARDEFRPLAISGQITLPTLMTPVPATLFISRAPRSFTGQDQVEIHTIGSPPILELALSTFVARGTRPAVAGEFTMRAFLNGKLDLTAAEAILGLIDATTPGQADVALRQMAGGIARPIGRLREHLLNMLAELEAGLDFAEEDLEFIDSAKLRVALKSAMDQLQYLHHQMEGRTLSQDRRRAVLMGPPNAGKSSLFNALLGSDAALVHATAGTTRDYLVGQLCLSDSMIELVDTAGLENACGPISHQAQIFREQVANEADLVLWCMDMSDPSSRAQRSDQIPKEAKNIVLVLTKSDLVLHANAQHARLSNPYPAVSISAVTGSGLAELRVAVETWLRGSARGETGLVASTVVRCRQAIAGAQSATAQALAALEAKAGDDLIAMELRLALDELAQVVGAVYTDDILDRIFSRFCIGK